MELTLDNSKRVNDIFYWDIPFSSYKIQSITVTTNEYSFRGFYNYNIETEEGVEQYLQSGRPDDTCPSIFTGQFSVFFKQALSLPDISNVSEIKITIIKE
jgi:hypothetical protein